MLITISARRMRSMRSIPTWAACRNTRPRRGLRSVAIGAASDPLPEARRRGYDLGMGASSSYNSCILHLKDLRFFSMTLAGSTTTGALVTAEYHPSSDSISFLLYITSYLVA